MTKLIDISEASKLLGLEKQTLYSKVSAGKLPYTKISGKLQFDTEQLELYIQKHTYNKVPKTQRHNLERENSELQSKLQRAIRSFEDMKSRLSTLIEAVESAGFEGLADDFMHLRRMLVREIESIMER